MSIFSLNKLIDTQLLSNIQDSISEITDLSFSVYDSKGVLLMPSPNGDKLTAQIKTCPSVREKYEEFIRNGIVKAFMRKDPSILEGPASEHHLFIPIDFDNIKLVFVSNAFYLIRTEFEEFLVKNRDHFGISAIHLELWLETIKIKDYQDIQKMAVDIKCLFESFLRCSYDNNLNIKSYKRTKTLADILLRIQLPVSMEKVYSLVLDVILLLFDVDSVSIMVKEKNFFKTTMASGRLRNEIRFLCVEDTNPVISQSLKDRISVFTNNVLEIHRLGLAGSITSIQVFHLSRSGTIYGAVVIFNPRISEEESRCIFEFCRLISLVLENLIFQNVCSKCINDMEALNMAVTELILHLYNQNAMYESILNKAMELLRAEKGSFMLPEDDYLIVKAVKGVHERFVKDIKVKIGEGIAGKVFKDGNPLLVEDMEEIRSSYFRSKSHYKADSFICMPLKSGSETMGVLNISDKKTGGKFTKGDLNLINQFASYASITLKASNYYTLAEQMKEFAITDSLTGLFNRRYFHKRFTEEIWRSGLYKTVFSLAIIDIDNFRLFNETEGQPAGDGVLRELSRISQCCIRAYDILSRFGGEEFAILMPQTDKEEAFVVAERIRESIKVSFTHRWKKFPYPSITVSVGIASFPDNGRSIDELTESADAALYKAKSMGKDRTIILSLFNDGFQNATIS